MDFLFKGTYFDNVTDTDNSTAVNIPITKVGFQLIVWNARLSIG